MGKHYFMTYKFNPDAMRTKLNDVLLPDLDLRPFIDGQFRDISSDRTLQVNDPFLLEQLVEMPLPTRQDTDKAVQAASRAFTKGGWPLTSAKERSKCLEKLAELIEDNLEDLSILETADTGRLFAGVKGWEVPHAAEVYRYYAGFTQDVGRAIERLPSAPRIEIRREAIGVCALIIPWNFPFACIAWKMAPALAAGCTVIVKTPERTPLAAQFLAKLVKQAGFPDGVVNILTGVGSEVGDQLIKNPMIDLISFTGSPSTAEQIVTKSSSHFPKLILELGGKSPNLIFPDADIEKAAFTAVDAIFGVSGQNCCAGSRTIVHDSIVEEFTEALVRHTKNRKLGDPMDESTEQGPQIDNEHVKVIDSYVVDAIEKGANPVTGGSRCNTDNLFYLPTILTGVTCEMLLDKDEIFGPVGSVYTFSSEEEAFRMANDTEYGLAAGIWTSDLKRVERFIASSNVGTCWVNTYGEFDIETPWGGTGISGYGRELGKQGFEEYIKTRSIYW